jgi:hypothetical protein
MVQKTSRKAKSAMKGFGSLVATTGAVAAAGCFTAAALGGSEDFKDAMALNGSILTVTAGIGYAASKQR